MSDRKYIPFDMKRAAEYLEKFTAAFCQIKDSNELAFRCDQCLFRLPDGVCRVKSMRHQILEQ